jgi:hypothetical protein
MKLLVSALILSSLSANLALAAGPSIICNAGAQLVQDVDDAYSSGNSDKKGTKQKHGQKGSGQKKSAFRLASDSNPALKQSLVELLNAPGTTVSQDGKTVGPAAVMQQVNDPAGGTLSPSGEGCIALTPGS